MTERIKRLTERTLAGEMYAYPKETEFDMYFLDETYELGDGDYNIHNTFSELVDIVLKLSGNDFDLAEEIMREAGMPEDQIEFLLD